MQWNKKIIVGSLFVLNILGADAQKYLIDSTLMKQYDFVHWERNRLDFFGDSPAFKEFFGRLDSIYSGTKEDNITIYHIGGSHIQAGTYAHRTRRYLTQMSEHMKGERGLVFPYTLAGTNNPWNYKVESDAEWVGQRNSVLRDSDVWGMHGITATTTDSIASVKLSIREYNVYRFNYNRLRIYHNDLSDSSYRVVALDSSNLLMSYQNDSLNYTEFVLKERTEEFEFTAIKSTADTGKFFKIYGFDIKNGDPGVIYNTIGVNGSSFRTYARCELFEEQLKMYPPDMFIISIGTNDTYMKDFDSEEYKTRYEDFLKMILRINPNAAIVLTVPNDSYYRKRYPNPHTKTAASVIEYLAKKYDMAVWNFYEIMGGKGSSNLWYKKKLMPSDRIHFSGKGYDIKADLFVSALFESWDKSMGRDSSYLCEKHLDEAYVQHMEALKVYRKDKKFAPPPEVPVPSGNANYHVVRSGETLGGIAYQHGVRVSQIQSWNGLSGTVIYPGQKLKLYGGKKQVKSQTPVKNTTVKNVSSKKGSGKYYYYTIESGDNLWDIANSKGTSVDRIKELNPGLNDRNLKVGQKLKIEK